jgi:hypothetical protein
MLHKDSDKNADILLIRGGSGAGEAGPSPADAPGKYVQKFTC